MALQLDIVTPEKKIFSDTVDTVVIPGISGEAGLLPNHAPLVTTLQPGELRYVKDGKDEFLAIGEGFVEISDDNVSVITDLAVGDAEIDEKAVEEALKRAEEALKSKDDGGPDPEAVAAMQAQIQKSLAQLNVKRRRRSI